MQLLQKGKSGICTDKKANEYRPSEFARWNDNAMKTPGENVNIPKKNG